MNQAPASYSLTHKTQPNSQKPVYFRTVQEKTLKSNFRLTRAIEAEYLGQNCELSAHSTAIVNAENIDLNRPLQN